MKSMTGFAQRRFEFDSLNMNIVFKSLNHRFLDVSYKGSGIDNTTEKIIKEIIKNKVFRGKVEIAFDLFDSNERKCNIHFNEQLSSEILDELLFFKQRYKDRVSLSMDSLLRIPMLFHLDYMPDFYSEDRKKNITEALEKVFNEFLASREQEGKAILTDILDALDKIDASLEFVIKESDKLEKELFLKFKEKMAKYLKEFEIDERRIAQEAAILAEKSCINEEINRIGTHSKRLRELLTGNDIEIKGREADFLAQEMQRETHTIASKTTSMEVHKHVLDIRREIEKIKQRVQNVE
jgi:uncharacterized protein (TIGR00255 family)